MNKFIVGAICIAIAVLLVLFKVNPKPVVGCCKITNGCASGETVTTEACEELNGIWNVNTACNTDTGDCE